MEAKEIAENMLSVDEGHCSPDECTLAMAYLDLLKQHEGKVLVPANHKKEARELIDDLVCCGIQWDKMGFTHERHVTAQAIKILRAYTGSYNSSTKP